MPVLAPAVPVLATAGGSTAAVGTTAAAGGTVFAGLTATQLVAAGVVLSAGAVLAVGALIDDDLDSPVRPGEAEAINSRAGDASKAERDRVRGCSTCVWCQINIQAQGDLIYGQGQRPARQGIGPYFQPRTIFVREGVIIAGLTHEWVKGVARRSAVRQIDSWGVLANTVAYIQRSQASGGLPPGEWRANAPRSQNTQVRYDINVVGTVNAFMS